MSSDELVQMQRSGKVVQGGGGQTFISTNGASDFKGTASTGSVYVEFDVPTNSLLKGGKDGWFKLIGPDASKSQQFMLNKQIGIQLSEVENTSIINKKLGNHLSYGYYFFKKEIEPVLTLYEFQYSSFPVAILVIWSEWNSKDAIRLELSIFGQRVG
nr:hypothetical protein [Cronobacter muytjensii]